MTMRFIFSFIFHRMWFRFNCFSLFKAKTVNSLLLWAMFGSFFGSYWIMYYYLDADNIMGQWYTYFVSQSFQMCAMSITVYYFFKGTRNAGIATAWMINCGINFIAQVLGLHKQIFWFDAFTKLFILGLAFYVIYDIYQRSRNGNKAL